MVASVMLGSYSNSLSKPQKPVPPPPAAAAPPPLPPLSRLKPPKASILQLKSQHSAPHSPPIPSQSMAFSSPSFGLHSLSAPHRCNPLLLQSRGCLFQKDPIFTATFSIQTPSSSSCPQRFNLAIRSGLQSPAESNADDDTAVVGSHDISSKNEVSGSHLWVDCEDGGGGGNIGKLPPAGGGGNGDIQEDNAVDGEFGPVLSYEEVVREIEGRAAGVELPADMLEAAKTTGIEKVLLIRYLDMEASAWPLGTAVRSCVILRNRMLADPSFLFKIGTEIIIDSCCATLAEVQKRGKDFWAEFELYAADLLVGVVVNVALVGMLAPYARIGKPATAKGFLGRIAGAYGGLPSSVFEAERPGCTFQIQQRIGTYFFKGFLYGFVGFGCGLVGQGIANLIITLKRNVKKSEEDIPVPPLVKSAALWEMTRKG